MLLNGVRKASIALERGGGGNGMEPTMAVSLRESLQQVSDPGNLDASVEEVFRLMLGVECRREHGGGSQEQDSVTAVVGFGGLLSGACVFSTGRTAALEIAGFMTGIGEICNMLAGAWKGKVPELAANCGLSVPAVITGRDYKLHVQAPEFQLHHLYRFQESTFAVTIVCDGLQ
jgi:chemotaxis protein CheX